MTLYPLYFGFVSNIPPEFSKKHEIDYTLTISGQGSLSMVDWPKQYVQLPNRFLKWSN